MTTSIDDPKYRVPGTNLTNATAWLRDNVVHDPPKFWIRHRVEFVQYEDWDVSDAPPMPGEGGTVVRVYPDCDNTPLYDVEWDDHGTVRGHHGDSLAPGAQ